MAKIISISNAKRKNQRKPYSIKRNTFALCREGDEFESLPKSNTQSIKKIPTTFSTFLKTVRSNRQM